MASHVRGTRMEYWCLGTTSILLGTLFGFRLDATRREDDLAVNC